MGTPPLPDWIRTAEVDGYTAAHTLCPDETQLYGTESLFGDWDGRVLLLAKDCGPSATVHERLAAGDSRPYRHEPDMGANRRLLRLAEPYRELGLLYGSALGNLLRDDDAVGGNLPNRKVALAYGTCVTEFALAHMPGLRWVLCLGEEAWTCASSALGLEGDWRDHRDSGEPLGPLVAAFHPAARVPAEQMEASWGVLARDAA